MNSPKMSLAQDALGFALNERLPEIILSDNMPQFRQFSPENYVDLSMNQNLDGDDLMAYEGTITRQMSDWVDSDSNSLRVLRLEACGNDLGNYGIPGWANDGVTITPGLLDRVRINAAFAHAGLDLRLTDSEAFALRDAQYTGLDVGFSSIMEYPALKLLNSALYDLNEQGKTDALYQIIDPSWGCGAGEIEVEIRSDPALTDIQMIPELYFSVCEDVTVDPWDKSQCRWWTPSPEVGMVSGTYAYQGVAADGETKRGKINIDLRDTGDALEKPVIVLR
jgi:hypothetical protein